jgi:hypothetical protein
VAGLGKEFSIFNKDGMSGVLEGWAGVVFLVLALDDVLGMKLGSALSTGSEASWVDAGVLIAGIDGAPMTVMGLVGTCPRE